MGISKRIVWVDVVKYICILMVMLSHLEARTDVWNTFYTPFFLSAFFFVSGYVYKPKDGFKQFIYKKFRQLFIPWLIFSVFDLLLSQILSFNEHESLLTELTWNFLQIRGHGDGIWFVAALFVAFIPFYFFIRWYEAKNEKIVGYEKCVVAIVIAWILSLISVLYARLLPDGAFPWGSAALPWHIEYVFQAMFYMVLGYIFKQKFEIPLNRWNNQAVCSMLCLIYLLLVFIPYVSGITLPMALDVLYDYIVSIIGVTTVVMIAKKIPSNRYINYVGQNTLIYFALHGKVYSLIQTVLKKVAGGLYETILANTVLSSVFALLFALLLSVLLIVPALIINKWFPFIIGRKRTTISLLGR